MNSVIDEYKLNEMTDNTDAITVECLAAAESRVASYLRSRYNTEAIFAKRDAARDPEIVAIVKNMALYFLCRRHNVDILYNRVKEAYDADISYLKELARGTISANLPGITTADGKTINTIRMGSNPKIDHNY